MVHRSWLFPRDPAFEAKAGRILDLYARTWEDAPLTADDFVLSADEKTSIQARRRIHPTVPPRAGQVMKVEHEYERAGAWAYLAAWDVHRAKIFGRCEPTTGTAPFDRLVAQVMTVAPYRNARRVFWIVDNGSSRRGARAIARLQQQYPNLVLVHGPVHASWLNQIEIYFSISTGLLSVASAIGPAITFDVDLASPQKPGGRSCNTAAFPGFDEVQGHLILVSADRDL